MVVRRILWVEIGEGGATIAGKTQSPVVEAGARVECSRCSHPREAHSRQGCAGQRGEDRCWCLMKPTTVMIRGKIVQAWDVAPKRM